MAPISKAKKQMAYARSCRGKDDAQKVEIKKAYLRACKKSVRVEKAPVQRESESQLRDALLRNLETFFEGGRVSGGGRAQEEDEEDAPWVEDEEMGPEVDAQGEETGAVSQRGLEVPVKVMSLKRWDPKTDGGHLPGLRGVAAGGNSKRTEQRRRKRLESEGDAKLT